ncbi:carbohydrate kinase, thermoresistant glucokinase family protein [Yersinia rochesterensis]|uniref:Gluconokinase n=1 Tax=Yersinia rochesterensis TaxID=1604335 RepID=A0A386HJ29_9GAMM|nr:MULTISPECIES: gluconokinase [Yersinia]AJI87744.1 carbohydrate kinase, thermoresistant glucokinase family protein [Yersinia frederiksenii Y225]CNH59134.1 putative gluconokinase [Yersinia kristensenii]AIN16901.1 carbohydrate kinase, thermoresistant glucokinase family protein [Yersinia rochesterensis]AJJ36819.1 carbohydrate kinase, thermoresistant glucokinase family protein [Yersinia rochesterensis]AYD45682.1 gluconokinase [Yersinia rochesterensis]
MAGRSIIVMGVSGSGKTTVGEAVARRIHAKFIDGDDLHPRANIQKMGSGHPLNDEDRMPWLERLSDAAYSLNHKNETGIIVCSALKRRYRDRLREGNPEMVFLYLKGSFEVIMGRLKARSGHFMPTDLLKSQFDALEEPGSEEPDVICVDIDADIDEVVQRCVLALEKQG